MKLTVLTLIADRPAAFALCERWMARETVKPHQWIIVDDGDKPITCTQGQQYVRLPAMPREVSLARKLRHVLEKNLITGDALVFIEDDDFYTADYLETVEGWLKKNVLVGECRALYYNVQNRWWCEYPNLEHASLCSTALRREGFGALWNTVQKDDGPFVDMRLWFEVGIKDKMPHDPRKEGKRVCLGMKGLPGRVGYSSGHSLRDPTAHDDFDLADLRKFIGDEADLYAPFRAAVLPPAPAIPAKPVAPLVVPEGNIARSECGRVHGPNWLKWLGHLRGRPNVHGFELGTWKGESAEWFLDNICTHPTSRFRCIDTFEGSMEHRIKNISVATILADTQERLRRFGNKDIVRDTSHRALRRMELAEQYDFCYVDGSHTARDVLRDAVLAWDILKIGGVMIFDDYTWVEMPNPLDRPQLAIDAFLNCYAKQAEVLPPKCWQVAVRKRQEES